MPETIDQRDGYVEVWVCDPPPLGAPYRVIREEWVEDDTVRRIYEISLEPEKTSERA